MIKLLVFVGIIGSFFLPSSLSWSYSGSYEENPLDPFSCQNMESGEKRCNSAICNNICELHTIFGEAEKRLSNQCLGEVLVDKSLLYSERDVSAFFVEGTINKIENEIEKLQKKYKVALKKNCPDCSLEARINMVFQPRTKKKTCPLKYINHYKYYEIKKVSSANGCGKEESDEIKKHFKGYMNDTLINMSHERYIALYSVCPSECSFHVQTSAQMNYEKCSARLDLNVFCTHLTDSTFGIPNYDIQVGYKVGLQCAAN